MNYVLIKYHFNLIILAFDFNGSHFKVLVTESFNVSHSNCRFFYQVLLDQDTTCDTEPVIPPTCPGPSGLCHLFNTPRST